MLHIFLACSCIMSSELYYDALCTYLHGWIWLFKLKLHIELFHPNVQLVYKKIFKSKMQLQFIMRYIIQYSVWYVWKPISLLFDILSHGNLPMHNNSQHLKGRRSISGVNLSIPWSLSDMQLNEAWYQQCLHKIHHSMTATQTNYFRHIRDRFCNLFSMHVHLHVKGRHTHF